jgi:hypothetical protein
MDGAGDAVGIGITVVVGDAVTLVPPHATAISPKIMTAKEIHSRQHHGLLMTWVSAGSANDFTAR